MIQIASIAYGATASPGVAAAVQFRQLRPEKKQDDRHYPNVATHLRQALAKLRLV